MKKHLKRLPAPRSWTIPRKTDFWVVKPSPGPHPIDTSVPLGLILRDMLKVCANAREARHILNGRGVLVDGRAVTDPKFPVGLMDVLTFAATKAHYRMLVNTRGKMALVPIDEYEELMEDLNDLAVVAERRDEPRVSFTEVKRRLREDGRLPS